MRKSVSRLHLWLQRLRLVRRTCPRTPGREVLLAHPGRCTNSLGLPQQHTTNPVAGKRRNLASPGCGGTRQRGTLSLSPRVESSLASWAGGGPHHPPHSPIITASLHCLRLSPRDRLPWVCLHMVLSPPIMTPVTLDQAPQRTSSSLDYICNNPPSNKVTSTGARH